jgi:hypothetical protein
MAAVVAAEDDLHTMEGLELLALEEMDTELGLTAKPLQLELAVTAELVVLEFLVAAEAAVVAVVAVALLLQAETALREVQELADQAEQVQCFAQEHLLAVSQHQLQLLSALVEQVDQAVRAC